MIDKLNGQQLGEILQSCGFGFSKSLGQNFLSDERILNRIADDARVDKESCVLEIGTGAGTLTRVLARRCKRVVTVEVDDTLTPVHAITLDGFPNITVVHHDFLKLDIQAFYREYLEENFCVAANLPYYITTPILMRLLESGLPYRTITVLVQKEVARRMAAAPGEEEYGALSAVVQFYTQPVLCSKLPAACFYPRPKVDSAVIRLTRLEQPPVQTENRELLFRVLHAAFAMRRKTMANNLMAAFSLSRPEAEEVLREAGLNTMVRGEKLGLPEFARMADILAHREASKGTN